jgi:glycosyltransferase involved in cell wall biosynthesis
MHASSAAAAIACAQSGVPLVITEHSEGTWRDARAWRTSRTAYRRASHVIAVSERIARRLIEQDRLTPERVTTIANALSRQAASRARRLRAVTPGEPIIGVVARLVPEKGVAYFLRAAARAARELPHATFVIVGDGPLRDELAALADDLDLGSRVRFLGARRDGPELIAELDVLVVPSLSEGTPLVTLEALSAGVALVASAVGGIPDQIGAFPGTALVPAGDVSAFARAMVAMAHVNTVRCATSERTPISLLPGHDAMVRRTESVYASVLRGSRQRAPARERIARRLWLVH